MPRSRVRLEVALRAKRRAGELLARTITKGGDEPKAQLGPLGIGRLDSQRWQAVASVPELSPAEPTR